MPVLYINTLPTNKSFFILMTSAVLWKMQVFLLRFGVTSERPHPSYQRHLFLWSIKSQSNNPVIFWVFVESSIFFRSFFWSLPVRWTQIFLTDSSLKVDHFMDPKCQVEPPNRRNAALSFMTQKDIFRWWKRDVVYFSVSNNFPSSLWSTGLCSW